MLHLKREHRYVLVSRIPELFQRWLQEECGWIAGDTINTLLGVSYPSDEEIEAVVVPLIQQLGSQNKALQVAAPNLGYANWVSLKNRWSRIKKKRCDQRRKDS